MSCSCKIGGGPDGVCFECKSRRAFNARLKKLEDAKDTADYERGIAEGERRERARVVAWLRERSQRRTITGFESAVLLAEAGIIERGEHTKAGRR